jgi:hypothetical protein
MWMNCLNEGGPHTRNVAERAVSPRFLVLLVLKGKKRKSLPGIGEEGFYYNGAIFKKKEKKIISRGIKNLWMYVP